MIFLMQHCSCGDKRVDMLGDFNVVLEDNEVCGAASNYSLTMNEF